MFTFTTMYSKLMRLCVVFFGVFLSLVSPAQQNPAFESGIDHWIQVGTGVSADTRHGLHGTGSAMIGTAGSGIMQATGSGPLELLNLTFAFRSSAGQITGRGLLRFYDRDSNLLVLYKQEFTADTAYGRLSIYTEAPPHTEYAVIGAEVVNVETGMLYLDSFHLERHIDEHPPVGSSYDLTQTMKPFWKSDTIFRETVLLYAGGDSAATGKLLFTPAKILSVTSFNGKMPFVKEKDYRISGRTITRPAGSLMPFTADKFFDRKHNLAWYDLQSKWVTVTYIRKSAWAGPVPQRKLDRLPVTRNKLLHSQPLSVIAIGMSITRGMNTSGYDNVHPHMPSYIALWKESLQKKYPGSRITVSNAALPGARVDWGAKYAEIYINPLQPQLVVIDFGMNDFWNFTPEDFGIEVSKIITTVRNVNSSAEFILISNMKFDPEYILPTDPNRTVYLSRMAGYNAVLQKLQGKGVVNFDMTTLSDFIYRQKKARDCISNPLHPNDYLARWYAQGLFETVGAK